jgi:hypothetical protein
MAQRRLVKQAAFTLPVIFFFGCAADPGDSAKDGGIVVAAMVSNNTTNTGSGSSGSNGTYGGDSTPSTSVSSIGSATTSSSPSGGTSTTSSTPSSATSTTSSSSSSATSSVSSSSSSSVVPPTDGGCVVVGPAPANVIFHVTGAFCVQSTGGVMGWQGSNMAGRTVTIIGATTQTGVAATGSSGAIAVGSNGAVIWEFTAGTDVNAEMSWW